MATDSIHNHEGRKYLRRIHSAENAKESVFADAYAIIEGCGVTCPAIAHAVKKLLFAGQRGKGGTQADLNGALACIYRAIELQEGREQPVQQVIDMDDDDNPPCTCVELAAGSPHSAECPWAHRNIVHLDREPKIINMDRIPDGDYEGQFIVRNGCFFLRSSDGVTYNLMHPMPAGDSMPLQVPPLIDREAFMRP